MQFEVKIGERRVLASGHLVLGPADREVTFTLEGMNYIMTFTPTSDPGPFQVRFDRRDPTHLHVDTRGHFPAGTVAWTYAGILQFTDADIDLDLMIYSESAQADSVRRIGFTFTARQKAAAEMIDPTGSAPAAPMPRNTSSAPPMIPLRTA
jgi:hypothetical protein